MKNKILALIITLGIFSAYVEQSHADTCSDNLVKAKVFSSATAVAFCGFFATYIPTDATFLTGKTISIQEATAGSACSGTLTLNGATPVVTSTTCATTGSRIFLTRTSAETTALNPYVSAISTGVSFSVTSEAGDTGTANWFIVHEAP